MFVQTEVTPNPNSLKFLPGRTVSNGGSFEITKKDDVKNELVRNLMSINGVEGIFLSKDFISINKYDETSWDEIKHIVISLINDFYSNGREFVIDKSPFEIDQNLGEIEKKIVRFFSYFNIYKKNQSFLKDHVKSNLWIFNIYKNVYPEEDNKVIEGNNEVIEDDNIDLNDFSILNKELNELSKDDFLNIIKKIYENKEIEGNDDIKLKANLIKCFKYNPYQVSEYFCEIIDNIKLMNDKDYNYNFIKNFVQKYQFIPIDNLYYNRKNNDGLYKQIKIHEKFYDLINKLTEDNILEYPVNIYLKLYYNMKAKYTDFTKFSEKDIETLNEKSKFNINDFLDKIYTSKRIDFKTRIIFEVLIKIMIKYRDFDIKGNELYLYIINLLEMLDKLEINESNNENIRKIMTFLDYVIKDDVFYNFSFLFLDSISLILSYQKKYYKLNDTINVKKKNCDSSYRNYIGIIDKESQEIKEINEQIDALKIKKTKIYYDQVTPSEDCISIISQGLQMFKYAMKFKLKYLCKEYDITFEEGKIPTCILTNKKLIAFRIKNKKIVDVYIYDECKNEFVKMLESYNTDKKLKIFSENYEYKQNSILNKFSKIEHKLFKGKQKDVFYTKEEKTYKIKIDFEKYNINVFKKENDKWEESLDLSKSISDYEILCNIGNDNLELKYIISLECLGIQYDPTGYNEMLFGFDNNGKIKKMEAFNRKDSFYQFHKY